MLGPRTAALASISRVAATIGMVAKPGRNVNHAVLFRGMLFLSGRVWLVLRVVIACHCHPRAGWSFPVSLSTGLDRSGKLDEIIQSSHPPNPDERRNANP